MIAKITNFFKEVRVELSKVSWPTKNDLIGSTLVVIVSVTVLAIFIGTCDFVFSRIIHLILR